MRTYADIMALVNNLGKNVPLSLSFCLGGVAKLKSVYFQPGFDRYHDLTGADCSVQVSLSQEYGSPAVGTRDEMC